MFLLKNEGTNAYLMMYSSFNGRIYTPETVSRKMAKRFSKKEVATIKKELAKTQEFSKYKVEKCS